MTEKRQTAEEAAQEHFERLVKLLPEGSIYDSCSQQFVHDNFLAGVEWSRQNDMRAIDEAIERVKQEAIRAEVWAESGEVNPWLLGVKTCMSILRSIRAKYAGELLGNTDSHEKRRIEEIMKEKS